MIDRQSARLLDRAMFGIAAIALLIAGSLLNYSFVGGIDLDLVGARSGDGFNSQVVYIGQALADGNWQLILSNGLLVVHLLRYIVAFPFLAAENVVGSWGPLALMVTMMYPLSRAFRSDSEGPLRWLLGAIARSLPLLLPLVLSGRTILVAIGAGYIVYGLLKSTRLTAVFLGLGVALVALSSAAVLLCGVLVVAMFVGLPSGMRPSHRKAIFTVLLLGMTLLPSALAKIEGFWQGASGYTAFSEFAEQEETLAPPDVIEPAGEIVGVGVSESLLAFISRVVSRSTLYTSFAYGQESRIAVYLAMLAAAIGYVLWSIFSRRGVSFAIPVGTLALGLLMEGLGAWTVLWPLIWAYTGPDTPLVFFDRALRPPVSRSAKS